MNTINKKEQIWESLQDSEFREQFVEENINTSIAFQIRSLRNRQKLTQTELAQRLGGKQPMVSEWENPNYGKYTLGTLKELSKAFDVGLLVRFVSFRNLVDWTVNLTHDLVAPPNFPEEQQNHTTENVDSFHTEENVSDTSKLTSHSFVYPHTVDADLSDLTPKEKVVIYA